jgi:hypothetical protein
MTNHSEECGWVLKTPYSTNLENIKWPKTFEEIEQKLKILSKAKFGYIPYVMLQPCMQNRREYKVVAINGTACYVSKVYHPEKGNAFSVEPHEALFSFVESSIRKVKKG